MPSSSSILASAAADGASLTLASVESDDQLDVATGRVILWPGDLLQKGGMTMDYILQQFQQQFQGATNHLGGPVVATEGLKTSFRMFDEGDLSQAQAAKVTPVTKVIIAPH